MELKVDQDAQEICSNYGKEPCKYPSLTGQPLLTEKFSGAPAPHRRKKARESLSEGKFLSLNATARHIAVSAIACDLTVSGQCEGEHPGVSSKLEPRPLQDSTTSGEVEKLRQDILVLKEVAQQKDDFIGMAAHELRRPLTALVGYTGMLQQQAVGSTRSELAEWQIEALEAITHISRQLVDMTSDLLDATQLQAGKYELHCYTTDLVALAHRVIVQMRVMAKHHLLTIETSSPQIHANIDFRCIEQVLSNLISNAIKYSCAGSTVLLTIQEDLEAGRVMFEVRDQGIGIPHNQHHHVFNRFFRADNARMLGIEGVGLGLYLCREFIQQHRGRIWFRSVEGEGSSFYVLLPLDR